MKLVFVGLGPDHPVFQLEDRLSVPTTEFSNQFAGHRGGIFFLVFVFALVFGIFFNGSGCFSSCRRIKCCKRMFADPFIQCIEFGFRQLVQPCS